MLGADGVESGLDPLHVVEIFDRSLLASGNDQALLAVHQRNLRDLLDGDETFVVLGRGTDVNEGSQAVVLAEMATGIFVARGAVFDFTDRIESDERGLLAVAPQTQGFLRSTDGARFAAMLVADDLRLLARGPETVADEIDLGFHDREVVLRSSLQNEAGAESGQVGNAGNIEEHVLGKDGGESGEDFFGTPALALEVHDVRLHEDSAAIAEDGHGLGVECKIGILVDVVAEAFGGGLQEVTVAGGTLRVELEILHAAVVQDDDLDVLPTDVDDHVRVLIELQCGLGVGNGFDKRHVSVQNVSQNILGIASSRDAQNLEFGVLLLHLGAQVLEHLDGVLDRIAIRELVRLAQDVTVFTKQDGLGGSRAAIDADKASDRASLLKDGRRELLAAVSFLEHVEFGGFLNQSFAAGLGFLFLASEIDVVDQLVIAAVATDAVVFAFAEFNSSERGEVLRILRDLDQVLRLRAIGDRDFALLPHARDVGLPRFAHALDEAVWPAEQ